MTEKNKTDKADLRIEEEGPLYKRIKRLISRNILSGDWKPGDRVPSEHELVDWLHASRMTVNRALRELAVEGMLVRKQGSGTYVAELLPQSAVLKIKDIAQEIEGRGNAHKCEVLELGERIAPLSVSNALGLPERRKLYHVLCLHSENGVALQLEDRHVNPRLLPEFLKQDFTVITPSSYLLRTVNYTMSKHIITASLPAPSVAEILDMERRAPVLVMERSTWLHEEPVTLARLYYPGSRFRLVGQFNPPSSSSIS